MIGESLGPYKIIEKLGAGGMGEVYLAEDTRLGRQVAIKVLPSSVQDNPEGLARLEQEARILAQLEHPNVATVYGLERAATQEGSRPLLHLVMQYVEGETLADRIGAGAVPVDEALEIARQVAAGLGAAHDKGIVHRDLKPANVMLAEGAAGAAQVKVLDFGLAKAHGGRDSTGNIEMSASPTMVALTAIDVIEHIPDQARGMAEDTRVLKPGWVIYMNSPNRYSVFAVEDYVQLWGVGFVPRRWMKAYVKARSGLSYEGVWLMSYRQLRRLAREDSDNYAIRGVLFDPASSDLSSQERILARSKGLLTLFDAAFKYVLPSHLLMMRKAPAPADREAVRLACAA